MYAIDLSHYHFFKLKKMIYITKKIMVHDYTTYIKRTTIQPTSKKKLKHDKTTQLKKHNV